MVPSKLSLTWHQLHVKEQDAQLKENVKVRAVELVGRLVATTLLFHLGHEVVAEQLCSAVKVSCFVQVGNCATVHWWNTVESTMHRNITNCSVFALVLELFCGYIGG